jgi:hypothetical protein
METYAIVLFVLGMIDRVGNLADPADDVLGRQLDEEHLPKRIRLRKNNPSQGSSEK